MMRICWLFITYQWDIGELTACLFPYDTEISYEHSVTKFLKNYQERGR